MEKLTKYPKYKPSDIEWIGEIPEHWESLSFKYVTTLMTCGHAATPEYVNEEDGVMFLSAQNIQNERIDLSKYNYITKELHEQLTKNHKVEKGDILQVRVGGESTVGQTAIIDFDFNGGIYVSLSHIKLNEKAHNRYIKFLCNSTRYKEYSSVIMKKGAGVANFNVSDQRLISIPLPPINEQTAIANFLDAKTSKIDLLIEKKKKLIELLKEERTVIINQAVTKGINPNVKLKPSGIDWLSDIPEHWEMKKISYGFKKIGSGTTPPSGNQEYYNGTINWLQTGDLNDGIINFTNKKITEKAVEDFSTLREYSKGSLVIAMYGATIGKVGILNIDTTTNQACCVLSQPLSFSTEFIFWWFLGNKEYIVSKSYGGGQPNISQELIKSIRLPCPPKPEQTAIVNYIGLETKRLDGIISKIDNEIELLLEYRTALISEVVTGKIKVV